MSRATKPPREKDEHRAVDVLLPWYVNGSLNARAKKRVQHHVAACQRCQQEVRLLQLVRKAVTSDRPEDAEHASGGLAWLWTKIKSEQ